MSQSPTTFLRYVHNFRGLAILMIVAGHIAGLLTFVAHPGLNAAIQSLTINGSVYFVFIAGFLFQFLSRKYQYNRYLEKKVKNVILPYVLVSIPAILLCIWRDQPYYPDVGFAADPCCFHKASPPAKNVRLLLQVQYSINHYGNIRAFSGWG